MDNNALTADEATMQYKHIGGFSTEEAYEIEAQLREETGKELP